MFYTRQMGPLSASIPTLLPPPPLRPLLYSCCCHALGTSDARRQRSKTDSASPPLPLPVVVATRRYVRCGPHGYEASHFRRRRLRTAGSAAPLPPCIIIPPAAPPAAGWGVAGPWAGAGGVTPPAPGGQRGAALRRWRRGWAARGDGRACASAFRGSGPSRWFLRTRGAGGQGGRRARTSTPAAGPTLPPIPPTPPPQRPSPCRAARRGAPAGQARGRRPSCLPCVCTGGWWACTGVCSDG